jgi:hypothetical protein
LGYSPKDFIVFIGPRYITISKNVYLKNGMIINNIIPSFYLKQFSAY